MKSRGLLIIAALIIGLTLGISGMASATTISCGQCHGGYINNSDGTKTVMPGVPAYEDLKTPQAEDICDNTGRGLHGIHMNYSSASYGQWSRYGNSHASTRGSCDYCHNKHAHENGFVEFSGVSITTPTQSAISAGLKVSGAGITADGLDIMQMDGTATCTSACHKGTSDANPAPWGNYTSASIRLSCLSCHDDVVNKTGLSGAHAKHLNSAITVNGGLMGAADNAGCVNCHPDNTGDGRASVDDGSVKAYPHASDGTNAVPDNATIIAGVNATKAGLNTTCAGSCHQNTTAATWGDASLACDACHYYDAAPTDSGNNAAAVKLSGSHSSHFKPGNGILCGDCHTVPSAGDTTHAQALPPVPGNAAVLPALGWNAATHTCTTATACHPSETPDFTNPGAVAACAICHEYPGVAGRDWTAAGNGHLVRYDAPIANTHLRGAASYNAASDTYAGVVGDTGKCGNCHGGPDTNHRNGTVNVSDTHSLGNCGGNFTITPGSQSGVTMTCDNVRCHSGRTTPNWW